IGTETIRGEVKSDQMDSLDEKIKQKLARDGKFLVERPKGLEEKLYERLERAKVKWNQSDDSMAWVTQFIIVASSLMLLSLLFFVFVMPRMRDPLGGNFLTNYIRSPARRYEKGRMRVTFDDVADMQNAKSELQEIVEFLRGPEKFQRLGAQVPKGVLLVG